ncbi:hypothetical protein OC842_004676, partial [Tilletia horrida]
MGFDICSISPVPPCPDDTEIVTEYQVSAIPCGPCEQESLRRTADELLRPFGL